MLFFSTFLHTILLYQGCFSCSQVLDFQLKKQEMMKLEAAIKLKNEEQEMEARRVAEEKENNRRQKIKSKVGFNLYNFLLTV